MRQLAVQVAPVGNGLHRCHAQARGIDGGGLRLPVLLRARQRPLGGFQAQAGDARLLHQRLMLGFVLLVAPDLILQQGQGLGRLRLFAAQALEGVAFLGKRGQAGTGLGGLGIEVLPGFGGLGALVFAPQFREPVHVGVELRHRLRAGFAVGQGARQCVLGLFVDALRPAIARIQQRAAFGRHALVEAVAVAGGELAR
ncbi:hypothetical protein D3C72_1667420 [compost metagenome]